MSRLKRKAPVAQLDERRASISQDVGSNPSGGANVHLTFSNRLVIFSLVAQPGQSRALRRHVKSDKS